jgi:hypothetical protein
MNNQEIKEAIKDLTDGLNSKFTPEQFKPRMEAKIKELQSQLSAEKPAPKMTAETPKFKRNPFDKIVNTAQSKASAEFKAKREKEELAKDITTKLEAKKQTDKSITEKLKKSVPVSRASTKYAEDEDGYCDKVIAQAKERRAKAKARSQEPQKTEGTKNKEKIEKVVENVKERAKADDISKSELWKLIQETEQLLNLLKKSYQDKITNGE